MLCCCACEDVARLRDERVRCTKVEVMWRRNSKKAEEFLDLIS